MAYSPPTPPPAQSKNGYLMEIVRTHTFPAQYLKPLHQTLTHPPALLKTLTAQLVAIALAQYPQIQLEPTPLSLTLTPLLQRAFQQNQLWDKISQEAWVNLLTWTVQDLEIPIALNVIQTIAQEPYREELWQLLITPDLERPSPLPQSPSPPDCALFPLLARLEPLICQDLLAQILENLQTLEPLFLGLLPQQSILEIPLPALTIHPCNALEEPTESIDLNQNPTPTSIPAPSPLAPPIVLEHYLTRPSELHRLPWELIAQVKQQSGLPMVQLLFLLIGHTMRRPHRLTLTHREILAQLDWDTSADQFPIPPPPDLSHLLQQLDSLTLTTLWMTEPTAAVQMDAISTSGHPWEILRETQGPLDWVTGRISAPAETSITLRPGLWPYHIYEKGGVTARRAWETFGNLALTLLERDHCRDPFFISLLTVLSLNAPEPQPEVRPSCYTVHTLLDAALPTTALATLQHHPDIAPTLIKIWHQALTSLVDLGWTSRPVMDDPDVNSPKAQPTDFYIAPYPDWLNSHSHSRKPTDWIAQWLAQPLQFIPPSCAQDLGESRAPSVPPSTTTISIRTQRRLRGSEIRSARKAKQLTQSQLAEVLHVHQSLIAKIEVGQRTVTEDLERSLRQVLEL